MKLRKGSNDGDITLDMLIKDRQNKNITNADKIRSMTDEEFAEWLDKVIYNCAENLFNCENTPSNQCKDCKNCYLAWLQTETK